MTLLPRSAQKRWVPPLPQDDLVPSFVGAETVSLRFVQSSDPRICRNYSETSTRGEAEGVVDSPSAPPFLWCPPPVVDWLGSGTVCSSPVCCVKGCVCCGWVGGDKNTQQLSRSPSSLLALRGVCSWNCLAKLEEGKDPFCSVGAGSGARKPDQGFSRLRPHSSWRWISGSSAPLPVGECPVPQLDDAPHSAMIVAPTDKQNKSFGTPKVQFRTS